jgi:hypothetical protein
MMHDVSQHADPRSRRRHEHGAPPVDALSAAVRLDAATQAMRERTRAGGPEPLDDEPPTGIVDLAALRAMLGTGTPGEAVDPAAAAWLAGGPDPAAARVVEQVDQLDEEEHPRWPGAPAEAVPVLDALREQYAAPPAAAQVEVGPSPEPVPVAPVVVTPPAPPAPAPRSLVNAPARNSNSDPRPGWSSRHDPRSLGFHVRADLAGSTPLQDVDLPVGPVLDQGQEGECVGCGVVDAVNVLRLLAGRTDLLKIDAAAGLYHRAQQLDDVPGESYTGTSVLAGMKAAAERGWIGTYRWAFGTRDVAQSVLAGRPVVVGVPWLSGMYDTGPGGLVAVTGDDTGAGHCLIVAKLRLKGPQGQPGPFFGWQNSWGRSYGDGGIGWIHHKDLAALLHGVGEAAVPSPGSA